MPKKILLADDSITIQKVVELTFSEGDYQVFAVGNGTQALRKIQEVRPDIALLDVIMPEASGYEVCEKMKLDPQTSRIPVLLLTGTFEPFDRKRAEAAGADGHLTKPFESQVLISRVEELIASALPATHEDPISEKGEEGESREVPLRAEVHESAAPVYEQETEVSLEDIVPDRYDDFQVPSRSPAVGESRADSGYEGEPQHTSTPTGATPGGDPMIETWDELASGLASAPDNPPFLEVEARPQELSTPLEKFTASTAGLTLRNEIAAEFSAASAPTSADAVPGVGGTEFTAEQLDRIASRVVERLSDRVVRDIAWEVIPEIAENLIRQRIRELEEKITREG
ncbi:MAG: response regulator [Acidobacteria bacterium]|nr:response regulator [Acidobacteriota bacterium]